MSKHLIITLASGLIAALYLFNTFSVLAQLKKCSKIATDDAGLYRSYGTSALIASVCAGVAIITGLEMWTTSWWMILPAIIVCRLLITGFANLFEARLKP